jgi:metal-responsive CopG/Arc/MetJ family transcriptional regulator
MAMLKTTVYLPDDLKAELDRVAAETGRSASDLIREGIRLALTRYAPPAPRIGIFVSGDPHFAENADEHLAGFSTQ